MKLVKHIFNQINTLTRDLTGTEICIDQNVPVINEKAHRVCGGMRVSVAGGKVWLR
jgi:hypothetical protein